MEMDAGEETALSPDTHSGMSTLHRVTRVCSAMQAMDTHTHTHTHERKDILTHKGIQEHTLSHTGILTHTQERLIAAR